MSGKYVLDRGGGAPVVVAESASAILCVGYEDVVAKRNPRVALISDGFQMGTQILVSGVEATVTSNGLGWAASGVQAGS